MAQTRREFLRNTACGTLAATAMVRGLDSGGKASIWRSRRRICCRFRPRAPGAISACIQRSALRAADFTGFGARARLQSW